MTATVIIPTTGANTLLQAVDSVLNQTVKTTCFVVVDGSQHWDIVTELLKDRKSPDLKISFINENVGANGFYGHRIYAAFTHLANTKFLCYLDQDNWFDSEHVAVCSEFLDTTSLEWCYSLRKIYRNQEFICNDDCESLGKYPTYHGVNHIDTNAYFLRRESVLQLASVWHGGWGQDRVFYNVLNNMLPNYECTGQYTLNYRVNGNAGSVNADFFINGNKVMKDKHKGDFPWRKKI